MLAVNKLHFADRVSQNIAVLRQTLFSFLRNVVAAYKWRHLLRNYTGISSLKIFVEADSAIRRKKQLPRDYVSFKHSISQRVRV